MPDASAVESAAQMAVDAMYYTTEDVADRVLAAEQLIEAAGGPVTLSQRAVMAARDDDGSQEVADLLNAAVAALKLPKLAWMERGAAAMAAEAAAAAAPKLTPQP